MSIESDTVHHTPSSETVGSIFSRLQSCNMPHRHHALQNGFEEWEQELLARCRSFTGERRRVLDEARKRHS